jgi:DNA-3-methyladenine glycosylase I
MKNKTRCSWCLKDDIYKTYHDEVWGIPEHDDIKLFEMLNLEGAQAGLSWYTVLIKQENYRKAFYNWDPQKIIRYCNAKKIEKLLQDPGIIRNKLKVNAVINNAHAFMDMKAKYGSFNKYIWQFVDGQPIVNHFKSMNEVPAKTALSDIMSKQLKNDGFKFIGSTIVYAYMQACGMVNDHATDCWTRKRDKIKNRTSK